MTLFIFLLPWIFVLSSVQSRNYSTWMADNALLLSSKTLGSICLAATHNSAAYNLSNKVINTEAHESSFATFYSNLNNIVNATGRSSDQLVRLFTDGIRAGSECITKSIYSQLTDGNRALDLRLSVFENDIYTAHVLQGPSLSDVLAQVWKFLYATNGEIVFMTLGHPYGFNRTYIDRLALLLDLFVTSGLAITPAAYPNDLLSYTYEQLVSKGRSRVIIVIDDTINPDFKSFFSTSLYSPPDGGSHKLYGSYTNTNNINTVIDHQTANYAHARKISAPAAMYMTLTPTYNDMISIIVSTVVADFHPLMRPLVLAGLRAILASENINDIDLTLTSLSDIYLRQNMIARRTNILTIIQSTSLFLTKNSIFLIYTDFYENNRDIVDLAISYSLI
ncbi:unnamed protein product [Adineta ricciae]|uniref:Uncharacterized protein n=1 Tax=Adineta ricciae TaxID=249248 RepID=A0A815L206_ADIRI|nr:unnamed protein product [Adineta ricciae]